VEWRKGAESALPRSARLQQVPVRQPEWRTRTWAIATWARLVAPARSRLSPLRAHARGVSLPEVGADGASSARCTGAELVGRSSVDARSAFCRP